ncbi:hypothetical protein MRX96_002416 [Rhipicephalus microplus]
MRPVYASAKSVMHDHFTGGVWKSLSPQPQPSHHQPTPQPQPPVGSWHSTSRQPHSCLAPGAHLEALLHQNREGQHLPAQAAHVRLFRQSRWLTRPGASSLAASVVGHFVVFGGCRRRAHPAGVLVPWRSNECGAATVSPQLRSAALRLPALASARQKQRGQATARRI